MSRSKCLLAACVWCLLCCVQVTSSVADFDFSAPAGLGPGDTFHWVFVTSTTRNAGPTAIADYNAHVNTAAAAVAATTDVVGVVGIAELGQIGWRAIASAYDPRLAAKDNIGDPTSPIYRFDGALVANNEGDLFDGIIETSINLTETGTIYGSTYVWTGSTSDGSGFSTSGDNWAFALGNTYTKTLGRVGYIQSSNPVYLTGGHWISNFTLDSPDEYPLYAISHELTVVPLPGAVLLGILGLGVAGIKLRKFA